MPGDQLRKARYYRRFRIAMGFTLLTGVVVLLAGWLVLYFDSLHQRRRAESLIADLKSFQFASAGFAEVRDLVVGHGGTAI